MAGVNAKAMLGLASHASTNGNVPITKRNRSLELEAAPTDT